MAKNLKQVLDQIDRLQRQADLLRAKEVDEVVARIRVAIDHYGITPQQLFDGAPSKSSKKAKAAKGARAERPAKYIGENGETWGGMGKRPRWFSDALASGKSPDSMLVTQEAESSKAASRRKAVASRGTSKPANAKDSSRRTGVPKYHDGAGRTWTGKGKRPAWFVQAIEAGKSADDLLITGT